jgi:hypothetical protein
MMVVINRRGRKESKKKKEVKKVINTIKTAILKQSPPHFVLLLNTIVNEHICTKQ